MDYLKNIEEYVEDFESEMENIKQLSDLIKEIKSYSEYLQTLKNNLNNISKNIEDNMNNTKFIESIKQLENSIKKEGTILKENLSDNLSHDLEKISINISNLEENNKGIDSKLDLLDELREDTQKNIDISKKNKLDLENRMDQEGKRIQEELSDNFNGGIDKLVLDISDLKASSKDIDTKLELLDRLKENIKENIKSVENNKVDLESKMISLFTDQNEKMNYIEENMKKDRKKTQEELSNNFNKELDNICEEISNLKEDNKGTMEKLNLLDVLKGDIKESIELFKKSQTSLEDKMISVFSEKETNIINEISFLEDDINNKFETKTNDLRDSISLTNDLVNNMKKDSDNEYNANLKNHNINRIISIIGFIIIIISIFFTR